MGWGANLSLLLCYFPLAQSHPVFWLSSPVSGKPGVLLLGFFGPVPSCTLTGLLYFRETWGFAPGFSRLCRSTPILELLSYLGRRLWVQAGNFWNQLSNSVYFNYLSFRCKTTVACTVSLKICTNLWDRAEIPRRMLGNKDAQHGCSHNLVRDAHKLSNHFLHHK